MSEKRNYIDEQNLFYSLSIVEFIYDPEIFNN